MNLPSSEAPHRYSAKCMSSLVLASVLNEYLSIPIDASIAVASPTNSFLPTDNELLLHYIYHSLVVFTVSTRLTADFFSCEISALNNSLL